MKFLIDAHLPPGLRAVFQAAGHDAIRLMCEDHLATIEAALQTHTLVELDQKTVTVAP